MKWFWPALGLLFIALKLTGHISWPWVWVLAPLWFQAALWVLAFTVTLLYIGFLEPPKWKQQRELKAAFTNMSKALGNRK